MLARRGGNRVRHRAGAAARQSPRSERAVDLAHVVVQQHVGRARRSHAEKRADDPRRRHRRLEHVGLEPLIEKIDRAHRQQLHLVQAIVEAHAAEALADRQQLEQAARIERRRIGRQHAEDRLGEAAHLDHRLAVFVVGLGVEPRVARDLAAGLVVIVDAPQVIAVRHRRQRAVERQQLHAVARQIEVADDLGPQQRDDVRADRELEAGKDLFGDGGAAEHVPALEHEHLASRAREVGRAGQAVVAASDDDRVVTHRRIISQPKPASP